MVRSSGIPFLASNHVGEPSLEVSLACYRPSRCSTKGTQQKSPFAFLWGCMKCPFTDSFASNISIRFILLKSWKRQSQVYGVNLQVVWRPKTSCIHWDIVYI